MNDLIRYAPPDADEWGQLVQLSEMIATAPFVPDAIRGKSGAVMGCMLMGRELGIGPMQSLNDIGFIKGKRSLAATLMVSLVRGRGHKFRTVSSTATRAVVQIHRKGEPEPEPPVEFTWEDAQTAGLTSGDNYKKYPKAMLWSRAASAACRRDASECLGGNAYTKEELDAIDDEDEPAVTTATWGEPVKDTGPQGTPAGARGRRSTADPADPVHTSGPEGHGAAPGPDQTPDALDPSGRSGGPAPDQVGTDPGPGSGASVIDQMDSVRKGEAADWLALHSGDQELTKWFEMSANTSARRGRLRSLPPELKTKAEALLVRHLSATFDEPQGSDAA